MAHTFRSGDKVKILSVDETEAEYGSCLEMEMMIGKTYEIYVSNDDIEINGFSWMPDDLEFIDPLKPEAIKMKNSKEAIFDESLIDDGKYGT